MKKNLVSIWTNISSEYHDLYVQSDILILADVFEIHKLDPAHCLTLLKKTTVKSEPLADIDLILMIEKDATGGICFAIHQYSQAINKYIKDYDKN